MARRETLRTVGAGPVWVENYQCQSVCQDALICYASLFGPVLIKTVWERGTSTYDAIRQINRKHMNRLQVFALREVLCISRSDLFSQKCLHLLLLLKQAQVCIILCAVQLFSVFITSPPARVTLKPLSTMRKYNCYTLTRWKLDPKKIVSSEWNRLETYCI